MSVLRNIELFFRSGEIEPFARRANPAATDADVSCSKHQRSCGETAILFRLPTIRFRHNQDESWSMMQQRYLWRAQMKPLKYSTRGGIVSDSLEEPVLDPIRDISDYLATLNHPKLPGLGIGCAGGERC